MTISTHKPPRKLYNTPIVAPEDQSVASDSGNLTLLLNRMQRGDRQAGEEAATMIYGELHRIASSAMRREHVGHTLQTTALVNEAYVRLAGGAPLEIQSRAHFYAIASQQMRRVLVDHARAAVAQRRGGGAVRIELDAVQAGAEDRSVDLLALDEALAELQRVDPRAAQIVEMRYFGGYADKDAADAMGASLATVRRDWEFARSWLFQRLRRR